MSYILKKVTLIAGFYYIDGSRQTSIKLNKGQSYRFDQPDPVLLHNLLILRIQLILSVHAYSLFRSTY